MKKDAVQIIQEYGGTLRAYDEQGQEVLYVAWIDEEAGTYGQYQKRENGSYVMDPDDPGKPMLFTRSGKLRLERNSV